MGGSDSSYPQGRKVRQHQLIDDYSILMARTSFKAGMNSAPELRQHLRHAAQYHRPVHLQLDDRLRQRLAGQRLHL